MEKYLTKVGALKKLLLDNGGIATWEIIYNEIEKYYSEIKKPKDWKAALRGVLYRDIGKTFKKVDEGVFTLLSYKSVYMISDKEVDFETEKKVLTKIRIGQNKFRKNLILGLKKCPITGVNDTRLLVASHIKPWYMSNDNEKLDKNNGFLFTPTYDKLFDKGFISFTNDKKLIISKSITIENLDRLGLIEGYLYKDLPVKGRENYLEYHREKILMRY